MNPLIPMLAVTGKPQRREIFDYMRKTHEICKIDCVMIYPRSGCELEYLSEPWFSMWQNFIDAAEEYGMRLWIYDEFNWPSGQGGGLVVCKNEEYRLKHIVFNTERETVSYEITKDGYFPDVLNKEAVDYFILTTHEEYKKRFSKYFGKIIRGIFTDEPSAVYNNYANDTFPYYNGMEEDYEKTFGTSMMDHMEKTISGSEKMRKLIGDRFNDAYIKNIREWCGKNNLLLTGHMMSDSSPHLAAMSCGNVLSSLPLLHVPGIDEILTRIDEATWLGAVIDYASSKSENGAMAELYALGPCNMSNEKRLQTMNFFALNGVDQYFLAVAHLDMRGNLLKKDYFHNLSHANPDTGAIVTFGEYAKRASEIAKKERDVKIKFRYDPSVFKILIPDDEADLIIDRTIVEFLRELTNVQIDFRLVSVEDKSENEVLCFAIGKDTRLFEEKFGIVFDNISSAVAYAENAVKNRIIIRNKEGEPCGDLFVRRFRDGTFALTDIHPNPQKRELTYTENEVEHCFTLWPGELYYSGDEKDEYAFLKEISPLSDSVHFDGNNFHRFLFHSGLKKMYFTAKEKLENVKFVARNYGLINETGRKDDLGEHISGIGRDICEVYLDGQKLNCSFIAENMPEGFNGLYYETQPLNIPKGTHGICIKNISLDCKYIPLLLLEGNIFCDGKNEISMRPAIAEIGQEQSFFGRADYDAVVSIPEESEELFISVDSELYTECSIDGVFLGGKISSPYIWQVPRDKKGSVVSLKLSYYSTLAEMFGDTEGFEKQDFDGASTAEWCKGFASRSGCFRLGKNLRFWRGNCNV